MRRAGAVLSGAALTLGAVAITPSAQAVDHDNAPLQAGGSWLSGRLTGGALPSGVGAAVDAALGFQAAKIQPQAVDAVVSHLDADVTTYTDYAYDYEGVHYTGRSSGSLAKSLVLAQGAGADTSDFGGIDLVTELEHHVRGTTPVIGRLFDEATADGEPDPYGDYANSIGQAFGARGLAAAHSPAAGDVLNYLLKQQCPGGGFRLYFSGSADAEQSCTDPAKGDPDVTAYVVLELSGLRADTDVADALDKAVAWLAGRQHADGSFGGGSSTEGANANSTGLAGWALGTAGRTAAAERAATWLSTLSVAEPVGCVTKLSGQTGAIAYDAATLAAARDGGITNDYQWDLATAQALPALQWLPQTSARPAITGPAGFRPAGSAATYRITGAVPGHALCVTIGSTSRLVTADAQGGGVVALALPASTTTLAASVADHSGVTGRTVTTVLGATKPALRLGARKVKRGKRLTVRVSGLAAGEKVTITLGRKTARTGTTNAAGALTAKVRVTKKLVRRPGRVTVTVVGQFGNRTNHTTVKVVR